MSTRRQAPAARRHADAAGRRDACLAAALALALNALLASLLLQLVTLPPTQAGSEPEAALEIVWIQRSAITAAATPRVLPAAPHTAAAPRPRNASVRTRQPPEPEALRPPLPTAGPGEWDVPVPHDQGTPGPIDPTASGSFQRRALSRPRNPLATDAFAPQDRFHVRMRDNSLGGRLRRLTQRTDCAELRAQLRATHGSGVDAIVRTMEERGCMS